MIGTFNLRSKSSQYIFFETDKLAKTIFAGQSAWTGEDGETERFCAPGKNFLLDAPCPFPVTRGSQRTWRGCAKVTGQAVGIGRWQRLKIETFRQPGDPGGTHGFAS